MSVPARHAEGFASWRRVLAAIPDADKRWPVFDHAVADVVGYVAKGLERAAAVDELHSMAEAYGLITQFGEDEVQRVIADGFNRPSGNGQAPGLPKGGLPLIYSAQEFVKGFIPPDYLIDGILQRRFVYALTGQTGHAKTAIALVIAELVACADPAMLGTHIVHKGRVLYFVGENPDDVRMPLIGACSKRVDDVSKDRMNFIAGVFNIGQMFNLLQDEVRKLGPLDLVIIDTSAAYFLGQDENVNPQIGAHARMLRALTTLPGGPTVLVLCHPIKHAIDQEQLLPRGGGAFLAEMDGNLTAWKLYDDLIELHHGKMRGTGFEPIAFKLDTIRTPDLVDAKGREIPTVRARVISNADEDEQREKTRDDDDRVMVQLLKNPDASISGIAEACGWKFGTGEPAKSRVSRALGRLEKKAKPALIRKDRDKHLLTEEGKKVARLAALRIAAVDAADSSQTTLTF